MAGFLRIQQRMVATIWLREAAEHSGSVFNGRGILRVRPPESQAFWERGQGVRVFGSVATGELSILGV